MMRGGYGVGASLSTFGKGGGAGDSLANYGAGQGQEALQELGDVAAQETQRNAANTQRRAQETQGYMQLGGMLAMMAVALI